MAVENRYVPLLLLVLPVYLLALGANSIWDANEAFYVETPRQMVLTGEYVHPTFNGQPRENKPVLSYWIVSGVYHLFGISVAVERLAIALGALATIGGVFLIGRALAGTPTGVLAALIFATAPRVVFFSRRIMIDVWLTCFLTLALAAFAMALRSPERRTRYLVAMYVAIGLGFLTKGPIAIGLPGLVLVVWLLTERRVRDLRHLLLIPGALIVAAIAAPWWGALYASRGWEPIYDFFITENFGRYATAMTTSRPPWFFLPVLFFDILLPWAPLLLLVMAVAWRGLGQGTEGQRAEGKGQRAEGKGQRAEGKGQRAEGKGQRAEGPIRRLLWWWIVAIVLFFSMAASKEDLYIYPVMPAAAALIAQALIVSKFGAAHAGVRGLLAGVGVLCMLLGAAVAWLFRDGYYQLADATLVALLIGGAGVVVAALAWTRRGAAAVAVLAAAFVALDYLLVLRVIPSLERLKPVPAIAATLSARAAPDAQVAYCNMDGLTSLVYYADRHILPLDCVTSLRPAAQLLQGSGEAWIVTGEGEWTELRQLVPTACAAARHPLFDAKLRDLIDHRPPPDVVLATNKCN